MSQVSVCLRSAEARALELDLMQDSAWSNTVATTGVGTLVPSKDSPALGGAQPVCSPRGPQFQGRVEPGEQNKHTEEETRQSNGDHLSSRLSITSALRFPSCLMLL